MTTWTTLTGYPVVSVRFYDDVVYAEQKRFYLRPTKASITSSKWMIPITWATEKNPNFNNTNEVFWLNSRKKAFKIEQSNGGWVILNVQQQGK